MTEMEISRDDSNKANQLTETETWKTEDFDFYKRFVKQQFSDIEAIDLRMREIHYNIQAFFQTTYGIVLPKKLFDDIYAEPHNFSLKNYQVHLAKITDENRPLVVWVLEHAKENFLVLRKLKPIKNLIERHAEAAIVFIKEAEAELEKVEEEMKFIEELKPEIARMVENEQKKIDFVRGKLKVSEKKIEEVIETKPIEEKKEDAKPIEAGVNIEWGK